MFSRSNNVEYAKEQTTFLKAIIIENLMRMRGHYCLIPNPKPFNLYNGEKVRTDHWTLYTTNVKSGRDYYVKEVVDRFKLKNYIQQDVDQLDIVPKGISCIHFIKILEDVQ